MFIFSLQNENKTIFFLDCIQNYRKFSIHRIQSMYIDQILLTVFYCLKKAEHLLYNITKYL